MPSDRRVVVRRSGALTRLSVRRGGGRARPGRAGAATEDPGRLRHLRSPAAWLAGILLTVVTVTFQDTLTGAVKAVLPLDRLPDRISPQGAVHVVEVKDVKVSGEYLVRGDRGGRFGKVLSGEQWRQKGRHPRRRRERVDGHPGGARRAAGPDHRHRARAGGREVLTAPRRQSRALPGAGRIGGHPPGSGHRLPAAPAHRADEGRPRPALRTSPARMPGTSRSSRTRARRSCSGRKRSGATAAGATAFTTRSAAAPRRWSWSGRAASPSK